MPDQSPVRIIAADRGDAGRRLDLVLRRHLTDVAAASRTRVQAWIEDGRVTVNGAAVRRVAARAALGDVVRLEFPGDIPTTRARPGAEDIAVEVLYEDEFLLAVNKPAGMVAHPTCRHLSGTLLNALLRHAGRRSPVERPSLLGRLDKQTSGVVIAARTPAVHAALQREWASNRTRKDYLAIVHGRVRPARGSIDLRLHRSPSDRRRMVTSTTVGAASLTRYERLAMSPSNNAQAISLLRCTLLTGRTHQIRVHLAARGWAVVGDAVYGGPASANGRSDTRPSLARQALHAWRTSFVHPFTHERVSVEAPLPADMRTLLSSMNPAWQDSLECPVLLESPRS